MNACANNAAKTWFMTLGLAVCGSGCSHYMKEPLEYRTTAVRQRIADGQQVSVGKFANLHEGPVLEGKFAVGRPGTGVKLGAGDLVDSMSLRFAELKPREDLGTLIQQAFVKELQNAGCEVVEPDSNDRTKVPLVKGEIRNLRVTHYNNPFDMNLSGGTRGMIHLWVELHKDGGVLLRKEYKKEFTQANLQLFFDKGWWANDRSNPTSNHMMVSNTIKAALEEAVPDVVECLGK